VVWTGFGSYVAEDFLLAAGFFGFGDARFLAAGRLFAFFMRRTLQQRAKGGQ
jgi:hypothetical protein